MNGGIAIVCALGAAVFFSLSTALKHRSAQHPAGREGAAARGIGAVGPMIAHMVRHPLWLSGALVDVVGLTFQVVALHLGGLVLVQPILVTAVVGSLAATAWLDRRHPTARELRWAVLMIAALTGFLVPLQLKGALHPLQADRAPGYFLGVLGAFLVIVAVVVGRWRRAGRLAASALGAATGLLYAAAAALITVLGVQLNRVGLLGVLRRDEIYVLLAVGIVSQVLNQASFAAAELSASVPTTTAVDLLASVVLGVAVFDHPLPRDIATLVVAAACLAVTCRAVYALSVVGV